MTLDLIHIVCFYRPYQNLGQMDRNLHNHVFDDVICKPPTFSLKFKLRHTCDKYEQITLSYLLSGKCNPFRVME